MKKGKLYNIYDKSLMAQIYRKTRRKINGTEKKIERLKKELSAEKFIPSTNNRLGENHGNRLKVRILYSSSSTWATIASLYKAFKDDERYEVIILIVGSSDESIYMKLKQMEEHDTNYIVIDEELDHYDIREDKPDIFVITNPWRESHIAYVRESCKLVVVASFTLIDYSGFVKGTFWQYLNRTFADYDPDIYFFDSLLYESITKESGKQDKIKRAGNLKYDEIYNIYSGHFNDKWRKMDGKKVILFATTHGIVDYKMSDMVSFDVYWMSIIEYMSEHNNLGLIFRPHPYMFNEFINLGIWKREDYTRFRRAIQSYPNIVYDDSADYSDAYGVCDAVITDAFCGISMSALPLMKPIGLLYRNESIMPMHKGLEKALYPIRNEKALLDFFDMICEQKDPKRSIRREACERYIMHFDGKNGERMKEQIERAFCAKKNGSSL